MKKVAIMTWWHYSNYGTALQVTALYHVVTKMGYKVDVIDYIPHGRVVKQENLKALIKFIYEKICLAINLPYQNDELKIRFEEYRDEYLTFTPKCKTESDFFLLNDSYEAFVCGSDQIWAPTVFEPKYFLNFVKNNKRKIAYAPSIGVNEFEDEEIMQETQRLINGFDFISVREKQGQDILKNIFNKDTVLVLDPTLLYDKHQWQELLKIKKSAKKEKYILCYFLGHNESHWSCVKEIAAKLNLPVKIIPTHKKDLKRKGTVIAGVGPREFTELLVNAEFVCTDSFHGVAFSLNFNVNFIAFKRFEDKDKYSQNSRIYNILHLTKMGNRLFDPKKPVEDYLQEENFSNSNSILNEYRKKSLTYLKDALDSVASYCDAGQILPITNTCCGCGACSAICKQNAIKIVKNKNGFYQADYDFKKCINCGQCKEVCPFSEKEATEIDIKVDKLYAVKSNDASVLKKSSSGGVGLELARYGLENNYDVYGCRYNYAAEEAEHVQITAGNTSDINQLSGSKYLQSNMAKVMQEISETKNKFLFIGTPCQVAAVDKILRKKGIREDCILVDLIFHGVPSYNMYKKYLKFIKSALGLITVDEISFRYKEKGWRERYIYMADFQQQKEYCQNQSKDIFYKFFEIGHCYMESCFECNYRTTSAADLRIGDYWGRKYKNDKTGVSMVIAHTRRGYDTLSHLKLNGNVKIEEHGCNDYYAVQYPVNPVKPVFYQNLQEELAKENTDLQAIADKYCSRYFLYRNFLGRIKGKVKNILNYD